MNRAVSPFKSQSEPTSPIISLHFFRPFGIHLISLIDPSGIPNNLLPSVARVANGKLPMLRVFGDDYDTPDGTGVRDYIHVMDLAEGHAKAVPYVMEHPGWIAINLGCGRGYSVLEVVRAFEKASGRKVPYTICPRRAGDIAAKWCEPALAKKPLGWEEKYGIDKICRDS